MYIMDQAPSSGLYEESSLTPLSQAWAPVKIEPIADMFSYQVPQPANLDNDPTYTSLETVYPESAQEPQTYSLAPYNAMLYSSIMVETGADDVMRYPVYRDDVSLVNPIARDEVFDQVPKDEGLGSSPSSMSSTSPPLPMHHLVPVEQHVNTSPRGYEYSTYSTSSTPESVVSNYSTAPECSNCGSRCDITWVETHFLCRYCLSQLLSVQRQAPQPPQPPRRPPPQPTCSGKRKKTAASAKHADQICSNCETRNSTLWRRSISDQKTVCNACGLYEKLHLAKRPPSMRKDTPQTRKRKTKASQQPKAKNSPRKNTKKSQEIVQSVQHNVHHHHHYQQQQYVPNNMQHYNTLPTYSTFQGVELTPGMNNSSHQAAMLPPIDQFAKAANSHYTP